MRRKSIHVGRPSAAMVVAVTALFVALGGVGYAAVAVPANSVGTAQLRHSSVTHSKLRFGSVSYRDIQPGAVGAVRANLDSIQARVTGSCKPGTAIGIVQRGGAVNCNRNRPAEFGATGSATVPGTTTSTSVASLTLPSSDSSSYLVFANPSVSNTTGGGPTDVTCTLAIGTVKQTVTVRVPGSPPTSESIPLQLAGPSGTATVTCSSDTPVSVSTAINALPTSANN